MNTTTIMIIVAAIVLVFIAFGLLLIFDRRRPSARHGERVDPAQKIDAETMADEPEAETAPEQRQKQIQAVDLQPLSIVQRDRFLAQWFAVRSIFVDEPGKAVVDADDLVKEVLEVRAPSAGDYEQQVAALSVNYPELAENYRAAHTTATRAAQRSADEEEIKQAMVYYRLLVEELLQTDEDEVEKKPEPMVMWRGNPH